MLGNLEPEERVLTEKLNITKKIYSLIKELGWDENDEIQVHRSTPAPAQIMASR